MSPVASPVEQPDAWPGQPDGFERLWTPHRMVYIDAHDQDRADGAEPVCPFCAAVDLPDADNLVVFRGQTAYAVLNLYPYNPGHLLICPYRHVAAYTDLTPDETVEVAQLTQQSMRVLSAAMRPHGFNLGLNQGTVAGAGVAAHLHQHVVPRWIGDANFFPVVAQTKALPQLLGDTRRRLAEAWGRS